MLALQDLTALVVHWARQWKLRVLLPDAPTSGPATDPVVHFVFPPTGRRPSGVADASAFAPAVLAATGGLGVDIVLQWHRPRGPWASVTAHTISLCLASAGRWVKSQRDLQVRSHYQVGRRSSGSQLTLPA